MINSPPIAIIGAMAQEVAMLRDAMQDCYETIHAGATIYHGEMESKPVVLMQCGIGKVNAALGTTLLIDHFNACKVINTGSAGALGNQLKMGDVVIAESLLHHDVDVTAFGYEIGQMAQMPVYYHSDADLMTTTHEAATAFDDAAIYRGLIVSGDTFVHSHNAREQIKQNFPNAQAVEMEAAAIAQVCYRFNTPFVVVRAISDSANGEANTSFEQFLATAAQHSAQMVRQILRLL